MSLEAETRAILEAAGAEKIKVAQDALGFVVAATFTGKGFDGQPHSGHTGLDPNTSSDPRDLARRLIEISRREHDRRAGVKPEPEPQRDAWEEPATTLTEEPTFAPDKDPFGPPPEPPSLGAEILAAEAEAGESLGDEQRDPVSESDDAARAAVDGGAEVGGDAVAGTAGADRESDFLRTEHSDDGLGGGAGPDIVDAFFTEADLPAIEGQDVAAADAGGSQFIFGDNLDQMRTAAIGLVMRHARALTPSWAIEDDAALIELRNFTMGVSEGRWPDDAGRRAELDTLEGTLAHINAIARARDEKVEFLEGASREDIQAFDPEAGWPQ